MRVIDVSSPYTLRFIRFEPQLAQVILFHIITVNTKILLNFKFLLMLKKLRWLTLHIKRYVLILVYISIQLKTTQNKKVANMLDISS